MLVLATFTLLSTFVKQSVSGPRFSGYSLPHLTFISRGKGSEHSTALARYVTSAQTRTDGLLAAITDEDELIVVKGGKILHSTRVPIGSEVIGWDKPWVVVRSSTDTNGYEWRPHRSGPVMHHYRFNDHVRFVQTASRRNHF